jgi:DNA polymerase IV (DinB-like DNA polymerase)
LKREIREREGLTCSVGIAPNKLIAKIASDFQKPDGLTVVRPDEVQPFLDPLRIRVIPGIGPKTEGSLHERAIRTIADLRGVERERLTEWFGKWGEELWRKSRGISESPVSNEWEPKSIGEQETFEQDTLEAAFILARAGELAAAVFRRLVTEGFRAFRTVTVTVRFANFVTTSRSHTLVPLTSREALEREVLRLLLPFLDSRENPGRRLIRLIGVRAEKLLREPGGRAAQEPLALGREVGLDPTDGAEEVRG